MRTDYSYKSVFKQIYTCKIFNMLNILGKYYFFFHSRLVKRCEQDRNAIKADKGIIPTWGY